MGRDEMKVHADMKWACVPINMQPTLSYYLSRVRSSPRRAAVVDSDGQLDELESRTVPHLEQMRDPVISVSI